MDQIHGTVATVHKYRGSKSVSEDDQMLLNCLEHVSYVRVFYLICLSVKLTIAFLLRL
jgi:hypothetical protein